MAAISRIDLKRANWQTIIIFTLGFWFSGSLVLDLAIMPSLYTAGMMRMPEFATTGYSLFWLFNRVELLCAAISLTGLLVLGNQSRESGNKNRTAIILSVLLLIVALIDTYGLTPHMSALGLNLNLFAPVSELPGTMFLMQGGYLVLEVLKLVACAAIVATCYRDRVSAEQH